MMILRAALVGSFWLAAGCASAASAEAPRPIRAEVTSSTILLRWPAVAGARRIRVVVAAEPPAEANGPLSGGLTVATLGGGATETELAGIAAATDVFVRVEADTARGVVAGVVHARTRGGPRAQLDSPVREVHALAPNLLQIVLANGNGAGWQRGPWSVRRRNGRALTVRAVHRHSIPVGQPRYEVGFASGGDIDVVDVDHRIVLALAEPIGAREVLRIRGPDDLAIVLPFSDRYTETPVVQLNQVGYAPEASRRYAYVSAWLGSGGALPLGDFPDQVEVLREPRDPLAARTVVLRTELAHRAGDDADAGTEVGEIDLARVPADEHAWYRIRVPGVGVSWRTRVADAAVREVYRTVLRGLFHNRWAGDLRADVTDHARPPDHLHVFTSEAGDPFRFVPEHTARTGRRTLRGGYHDAGDFDQRPTHTVVPQLLLRAFELGPAHFPDRELRLPESGNRIPDLLDEALWGVAAWEALQESDGGVRAGVESHRHPVGIYHANDDQLPYWTFARDPQVSARAAGVFAQAARLVRPYDRGRAERLQGRAVRAWRWARDHGASDTYALYATGELGRLDPRYRVEFEQVWQRLGPQGAFQRFAPSHNLMGDYQREGRVMPDYLLAYVTGPDADPEIVATTRRWLDRMADDIERATFDSVHAHRNPRPVRTPTGWGQGTVMGRYLDPVFARLALGDLQGDARQRAIDAISLSADYVLGANPLGITFFSEVGARHPEEVLHLDSLAFAREGRGAIPGIPIYGPVPEMPRPPYYRAAAATFHPAFEAHPPLLRYGDVRTFVAMNEFSVWECQAPHAEHLAVLVALTNERTP